METVNIDTSRPEFKNALDLVQFTSQSVFLTGKAGTGKSTFLKYLCETTKKKFVVLAPTGIAAINAKGCTLHSFFKLPFHPLLPDDPNFTNSKIRDFLKYDKEKIKILRAVELIIIDEISMVRADIIDFIDRVLRVYSGNMRQPFGGKQMLLVGDIFQLEPVVTADERDILKRFYETPFFFSARVFNEMKLVSIELTKVYRQTDQVFVNVLDHIRDNTVSRYDLDLLNTCTGQPEPDSDEMMVTLATRRDTVDNINKSQLDALEGDVYKFKGEIKGEFPLNSLPTSLELELKIGAQVIFVKNDQEKRWVNGTIGTVEGIDINGTCLYITTEDGQHHDVELAQWDNVRYTYNEKEKKIEEEELGVFIQFPVRLAWAITIHKSQGLTFNHVTIDFTGGVFACGQAYVALSRCRSLDGLRLKESIKRSDIFVNSHALNFSRQYNSQQLVNQALKQASADIEYRDCVAAFDKQNFESSIAHFFKAIHARYDIEKPLVKRFIRAKLSVITSLSNEIQRLKDVISSKDSELAAMKERMSGFADEYIEMAKECTKMGDSKSAMSNLDKALLLNPQCLEAYTEKTSILLNDGRLTDSIACANEALAVSPNHFKALYLRGKALFKMERHEEAVADLDRCTSLKPKNISAHILLGNVFSAMGMENEAALQWAIAERLKEQRRKED